MFSWKKPKRFPILVAHRGSSAVCPENTLSAFEQAAKDGADAVELDVQLSKDGNLVVIHDSRVDRTTSGRGRVREKTLRELKRLDAGSWFDRRFSFEKIPTLQEVLELFDGKLGINIEIKSSRHLTTQFDVIEQCLKLIEEFKAWESVMLSSFQHSLVREAKVLEPRIVGGVLFHPLRHARRSPGLLASKAKAEYFICGKLSLRNRMVINAHNKGLKVGVYTVNTQPEFTKVLKKGVDCIFSDSPFAIRKLF